MDRLELGDLARHAVTGFEGIVTAKVDYLQGCRQLCLQPRKLQENGEPVGSLYFDEPYVDLVERSAVPFRDVAVFEGAEVVPIRQAGPDRSPGRSHHRSPPK
jgi:hypothetical protein